MRKVSSRIMNTAWQINDKLFMFSASTRHAASIQVCGGAYGFHTFSLDCRLRSRFRSAWFLGFYCRIIVIAALALALAVSCTGQISRRASGPPLSAAPAEEQLSVQQPSGSIRGTIIDQTGAVVSAARVQLTEGESRNQDVLSDNHGQFSFANVAPGDFQLTITAAGFATQTFSGVVESGQIQTLPPIMLNIAAAQTTVQVGLPPVEIAEEQMKVQEKQRVLGIVPNFYVSYLPNAPSFNSKQKVNLAWKTATDPFTFVLAGGIAGIEQAEDSFNGYGQGVGGYAKRYGASYGDTVISTLIGDAILPSLLKQDPRYFYKGIGSKRSRILYAIANAVTCKGDTGHWEPNYSKVLGHLAAGGIANLYYPPSNRRGAALTFEIGAIGIGGSAAVNLFQEFLSRKFTPRVHSPRS